MAKAKNPYMKGPQVEPLALEGKGEIAPLVEDVFARSGYNARRLAEACFNFKRMIEADATVCLTLAGAMTPIGMSGPIISLLEKGFVDWIISTGANLYHDLHRPFGAPVVQGDFRVDDNDLYKHGVARIYDTFIEDKDTLEATDRVILEAVSAWPEDERPLSTAEFHDLLGKGVLELAPHPEKSFLAAAHRLGVPVYTSSPGDSSIGMNLVLPRLLGRRVLLDPVQDVLETAAIVRASRKNGVIELGGGSPKNFFLQTQPTLWQILRDNKGGHDFFVQITTDAPHWGGLSGATPSEAKSWGKVKDARKNNVVVYSCSSIAFPILAKYVLERVEPREPKRLMERRASFLESLERRAARNPVLQKELEVVRGWIQKKPEGKGAKRR